MNTAPPLSESLTPAAELAQQQQTGLAELVAIGMKLLRAAGEAALEPPPTPGTPRPSITTGDPALTYCRLTRAIRLSMALQTRIMEGPKPQKTEGQRRRETATSREGTQKKDRVRDAMEQAVAAAGKDPIEAEDLLAEIDEKLDDPEFGPEFHRTPIGIIVSNLCEEFALPYNGRIYTDAEIGMGDPEWDPTVQAPPTPRKPPPYRPQPGLPHPRPGPVSPRAAPQPRHRPVPRLTRVPIDQARIDQGQAKPDRICAMTGRASPAQRSCYSAPPPTLSPRASG